MAQETFHYIIDAESACVRAQDTEPDASMDTLLERIELQLLLQLLIREWQHQMIR